MGLDLPLIDLQVQTASVTPTTYLVSARGELDLYSAAELWRVLESLAAGGREVIVDLTALTFVDSTGLGVLVSATKLFRADDGDVYVVESPHMATALDIAGLRLFLNVERSVSDALAKTR